MCIFVFFKQKTAYEMRISDWSSDVCSSDLDWTQSRFRDWGLNVHKEGFEFGRGWWIERSQVRMTTPRPIELTAIPIAWSPPTNGTISAPVIVAPMSRSEDPDQWRGQLAGRIVMVARPDEGPEPARRPFRSAEHTSELQSLMPTSYA